jgi:predicted RNase H-like HicB family nuclease
MNLPIELDREDDGQWIAEAPSLPEVMAYGASREEALARVEALALRVLEDRLDHREGGSLRESPGGCT